MSSPPVPHTCSGFPFSQTHSSWAESPFGLWEVSSMIESRRLMRAMADEQDESNKSARQMRSMMAQAALGQLKIWDQGVVASHRS